MSDNEQQQVLQENSQNSSNNNEISQNEDNSRRGSDAASSSNDENKSRDNSQNSAGDDLLAQLNAPRPRIDSDGNVENLAFARSALVTGATGAVGRAIVGELLSSDWEPVWTVGRRAVTQADLEAAGYPEVDVAQLQEAGRLRQVLIDFEKLDTEETAHQFEEIGPVPVVFAAFGTTRKDAGGAEGFRKIDYGYNVKLAEYAKRYQRPAVYSLVSSTGAKADAFFLYPKVKGQIEQFCREQQFPHLAIWQPGLLARKNLARGVEKFAQWFVRGMPVERVARAMRVQAHLRLETMRQLQAKGEPLPAPDAAVYNNSDIDEFAGRKEE